MRVKRERQTDRQSETKTDTETKRGRDKDREIGGHSQRHSETRDRQTQRADTTKQTNRRSEKSQDTPNHNQPPENLVSSAFSFPHESVVLENFGEASVKRCVEISQQLDGTVLDGSHAVVDVLRVLREVLHLAILAVRERSCGHRRRRNI